MIVPYQQKPGQPPRRIEIERKTRLYAEQNIDELLRREGIDYSRFNTETDHSSGRSSFLPLEIFDDTEYESRAPHEWVQLGTDEKGVCAVDAKVIARASLFRVR